MIMLCTTGFSGLKPLARFTALKRRVRTQPELKRGGKGEGV